MIEYTAASYHFELAKHRPYLANVETNLGYLYFKINRFDEASEQSRSLGVSWQWLGYVLRTRHKDLLKHRTPPRRRQRKQ